MNNRHKKRFTILLPLIIIWGGLANAQIKGKLNNIEADEVLYVYLLKAADSSLAKDVMSNEDGSFQFDSIPNNTYLVSIHQMGYEPYWSAPLVVDDSKKVYILQDVVLVKKEFNVQGATVTASKPFLQRKIDRLVVNPNALIGNAGTTALEVLEKTPGVTVDINGNISMKGKSGVMIFVDDKPTYLSASDLANYLKTIPSSSIETIELMTNPPAKYDAAGNAGIINIKLKRNRAEGFNGGINLSYGQGKYARSNNSANLNYRINKFNFFTNISLNHNGSYQDLTINRYYYNPIGAYTSGFMQHSLFTKRNNVGGMKLGADYYINKKSTLGFVLNGFKSVDDNQTKNDAKIVDANNQVQQLIQSNSPSKSNWRNGSVNFNYNLKLDDKGKEIAANADYITYRSTRDQSLENTTYQPDGTLIGSSLLNSALPSTISIRSAKVDYIQPNVLGGNFDAGAKFSSVITDNDALFYDVNTGIATPNYEFTNRFKYQENISAAYANYAKDWAKLSLQMGLRLEHTNAKGYQFGNPQKDDSSFDFKYASLFPTVFALYRLDSAQVHQFAFNAGRRIDRPNYQDLNPFTYPIDRYTFYGGNPFLKPTFTYVTELSYIYKNMITTTFEYSLSRNLIQETNEQRGNIYYSRPGNFGNQTVVGFSLNGVFQIYKWWTLQLYGEAKNISYNTSIYNQLLVENRWYGYIGPTNQFRLTSKLSAELAGSYQTRILVGQFLTIPVGQIRMGASYLILKDKGTLKFALSDILYTNQPGGDIRNIENSRANWKSKLDSRVATISFSYRFSKGKTLQARKSGASDTEKGRVKMN